ncbi:MAG TPA: cytochrome c peroxidase, partial [Gammaproteobacteria bacterium]
MLRFALLSLALLGGGLAWAELPPVPVPAENPITEPKRVLGKMLFWDEQLSSDNTVACGTCHRPAAGGADPRAGVNPGADAGTIDDVRGSPGMRSLDVNGRPTRHP